MAEKAKATCQSVRPRSLSRTSYINARDSRISQDRVKASEEASEESSEVESRKSREVHAGRQE